MTGYCDSCDEHSDRLFDISRLPEFKPVVQKFNYRHVCQTCYDDLLEESKNPWDMEEERRGEERRPAQLEIHLSGTNREGKSFSEVTTTEDVSRNGLCVMTQQDLDVGSVLKLEVSGSDFEGTAIVEIMWKETAARKAGLKIVDQSAIWERLLAGKGIL